MIDIATVVFRDELPILKLQAQSIERYCQHIGIRNIYVIVNDDDDTIHQIDAGWWVQHSAPCLLKMVGSVNRH
jgi:hypothetical protein